MASLTDRLMQSPTVQTVVKVLRVTQLANAMLALLGTTRSVPGSDLRYRVRFVDSLMLARDFFSNGEYAALKNDAAQIHRFVDLGCNVGLFPLYLCMLRGDRDVSGILVDANPAVVAEARANMRLNALDGRVGVLHGLADAGPQGERDFFVTPNSLSSTAHAEQLGSSYGVEKIRVPLVDVVREAAARFGAGQRIDLLKLDIEGSELDFLEANPALLERCDRVIMEFHKPKVTLASATDFFRARGWSPRASRDDAGQPWGIAYFAR